jgi:DNA-binding response OmpR family regulator
MRILLAEDDKNYGTILKKELEEEQYSVEWVVNGVQAVLAFIEKPYEAVLLDLRMPRLNGNDALRIIKKIDPHVSVITFSGNAGNQEREESIRIGSFKCLAKPFAVEQLKEEIRNCFSGCYVANGDET